MATVTGRVKNGVVVIEGTPPSEGAAVTVVFDDEDAAYRLTAEEESALEDAEREIDNGKFVAASAVMAELRNRS